MSSQSSNKIFIVEDNELNLKLFTDLLTAHNFQVSSTRDAKSAFSLIKSEQPDLILMDIQLPEISGLDITKHLKSDFSTRHIPVIAVTAFAMRDDEQKILEAGCDSYIAKPISLGPFLDEINRFLGSNNGDTSIANNEQNNYN